MSVHYSSKTSEWETPQDLFDYLDVEFNFTLDVCATVSNAKCKKFFTLKDNGLSKSWAGERCWLNPPYGREIGKWMQKACETGNKGGLVVCLIPARTDTKWWWDWVLAGEITFIKGRLRFGNAPSSAPFPSAVVVFRGLSVVTKWWDWSGGEYKLDSGG